MAIASAFKKCCVFCGGWGTKGQTSLVGIPSSEESGGRYDGAGEWEVRVYVCEECRRFLIGKRNSETYQSINGRECKNHRVDKERDVNYDSLAYQCATLLGKYEEEYKAAAKEEGRALEFIEELVLWRLAQSHLRLWLLHV